MALARAPRIGRLAVLVGAAAIATPLACRPDDRPPPKPARAAPARWGGPLVAAPLISRGKRVESSPRGAGVLVDGTYRTRAAWGGGFPTPERPSWVAIHVGPGYTRLLLSWTSSGNHDYHDQYYGAPVDYRLETSADSTTGADGTWRVVAGVTGNPVRTRAHSFDFTGQRWVRMVVTRLPDPVNRWGLLLDEIDLHDLSHGGNDIWVFLGDSITSEVYDRAPEHQPSFAAAVAARWRGHFPAMIEAGQGRLHVSEAADQVGEVLALNPDARVIAVGVGSNDNDPVAFRRDLERLVRRIQAAGRIAMVARIPFQTKYPFDYVGPLDQVIDEVASERGLLPGPDFHSFFKAFPGRLTDGLHPDAIGAVEMNRRWAEAAAPLYQR